MPASKEKKPDQVVFDQKTQKYSASLTPYATNLGAPAIIPDDITSRSDIIGNNSRSTQICCIGR